MFLTESNQPWCLEPTESLFMRAQDHKELEQRDISDYSLIDRFSSIGKLQRVLAYCLRFKQNCLNRKADRHTGHLKIDEIREALIHIIRISQRKYLHSEVQLLTANKELNRFSSLITLQPFLDKDGLLRVGGRIQAAGVNYN